MSFLTEHLDTIINADCMDVLKKLPDKCVDLVLTDPPYFGIVKDKWDNQWKDIYEFQTFVGLIGKELKRVLKDNGAIYWFGDDKTIAYCQIELDKEFNLLNNIVWRKVNGMCAKGAKSVYRSYAPITERILFYDKGEDKSGLTMLFNTPDLFASVKKYMRDEKNKVKQKMCFTTEKEFNEYINKITETSSVVSHHYFADSQYSFPTFEIYKKLQTTGFFQREYEDLRREYEDLRRTWNNLNTATDVLDFPIISGQIIHPTQKPLNLISYLLERSSKEKNIVLDCFSGSGTTAIACHNLKRHFICIEKDPNYWAASMKRLEDVRRQMTIFDVLGRN